MNLTSKELSVYDAFATQRLNDKERTVSVMKITNPGAELIQRAWNDGRAYERKNLMEILEHLQRGTSVEAFDATSVLKSLISVLKENEKNAGRADA